MPRTSGPTKQDLQQTIDDVAEKLDELLDPILSREQLIEGLQELETVLNGDDDETDDDEEDEEA